MNLFGQMKMADFYLKLYRGELSRLAGYPFTPQKQAFIPSKEKRGRLPRATPEQQGLSSAHIQSFLRELSRLPEANPHSVMVLRHGKVIAEGYFSPYRGEYPHMLYSLSKTFTATAVGMAIAEKKLSLSDRVAELFPEYVTPLHHPKLNTITIRHLLTMQAGIRFNELGSVMEKDWLRGFMQSDFLCAPGERFYYNSINSYLLSAAIKRRTGQGLQDYLQERLFTPLEIEAPVWERSPTGIEKGGWGLSLRIEDVAKLGQLYLQKGAWMVNGKLRQLLPQRWVSEATRNQLAHRTPEHEGYGYHIWTGPGGAYHFNGIFGQYVVVFPQTDVVVALFSGSQNLMPEGGALDLISQYFGNPEYYSNLPLPKNVHALKGMVRTLKGLTLMKKEVTPQFYALPGGWRQELCRRLFSKAAGNPIVTLQEKRYHGAQYALQKSYGSLVPLVIQGVHGNFSKGMDHIRIECLPGYCRVTMKEGDQIHTVEAGTDGRPRYGQVRMNGEYYAVGATARWTLDEDDRDVLKLFVSFIETPDTRMMKFIFEGDSVRIRFDERPSVRTTFEMMSGLLENQSGLKAQAGSRLKQLTAPKTKGKRIEQVDC